MSSEQMRIELETFVNAGLQEGWRGWPLKAQRDSGYRLDPRNRAGWVEVCRGSRGGSLLLTRRQGISLCRFAVEN